MPAVRRIATALFVAALVFPFCVAFVAAPIGKLSPDACVYQDIARHIAAGDGLVVSYNSYQSWIGPTRPAWFYQQPVYPLALAAIPDDARIRGAIGLNGLCASALIGLVFLAARALSGPLVAAAVAAAVAASPAMAGVIATPLVEPMGLLAIFAGVHLMVREKPRPFTAGVILGASVLVRAANALTILPLLAGACLAALTPRRSDTAHETDGVPLVAVIKTAIVTLGVFALVQIASFASIGAAYPAYGREARTLRLTRDFGGAGYRAIEPSLTFGGDISGGILARMLTHHSLDHLGSMFRVVGFAVLVLALFGAGVARTRRERAIVWTLVAGGVGSVLLFALTFYFMPGIEAERYALVSSALLWPAAAFGLIRALSRSARGTRFAPTVAAGVAVAIAIAGGTLSFERLRDDRSAIGTEDARRTLYDDPAAWIERDLPAGEPFATNFIVAACRFGRPVITLPIDHQATPRAVGQFLSVHQPRAILLDRVFDSDARYNDPAVRKAVLEAGFRAAGENERFTWLVRG
ncbi:hypothetical protein K8I61_10760 [bacterium]|nr:hypothetical protein [bacterium]